MNTNPYMSKYEYTRIIGIRALQLSKNSPALVDTEGVTDPLQIAKLELKHIMDNAELNDDFKELCTDWQLKPSLDGGEGEQVLNDHSDPDYDKGVIDRLVELDKQAQPVC